MKVDDIRLDPTNPTCPACLFELWIQAMPCGCMIERQFADKLKDCDI